MKKHSLLLTVCLLCSVALSAQQTIGLFQNDVESFEGYTLFASNGYTSTYLIDNCGRLVNEWPGEYRPGSVNYLSEDGHLYRAVRNLGGAFFGGGIGGEIEKIDWEGHLVWSFDYGSDNYHQHHDIEVLPNGNVLILAWESKTFQEAISAGHDTNNLNGGIWPEHIVEVEPVGTNEGNIVWEWHLWDHLIQDFDPQQDNYGEVAMHPELLNVNFKGNGTAFVQADWIHANAVDYHPDRDEIIISSRHLSEFWIIDHSTTTAEAASHIGGNSGKGGDFLYRWGNPAAYNRGTQQDKKLYGQHDVHWIAEGLPDAGKIMIYNNGLNRPSGNASSVDIITPPLDADGNYLQPIAMAFGPADLDWTYFPSPINQFYSSTLSGAQRMPNGNTLICEGSEGHLFEITNDGNKVWEYICPVATGGPSPQGIDPSNNSVFRSYRYAADFPAFIGKDLTPGAVIELNAMASVCDPSPVRDIVKTPYQVFPNPVDAVINIKIAEEKIGWVKLVDALGRIVLNQQVQQSQISFSTKHLQEGIYFLIFKNGQVEKIICKH